MLRQSSAVAVAVPMAVAVVQPLQQMALHFRILELKAGPGTEGSEIACLSTTVATQVSAHILYTSIVSVRFTYSNVDD
jgi:hypothetical protein